MADQPAYTPRPAPTPPALPVRQQDEDADTFTMRVAKEYRHGNIWMASAAPLARLLLNQVSGNEVLHPSTREEALDILGRLYQAKETVSCPPIGYEPKHILTSALRIEISGKLNKQCAEPDLKLAAG